MMGDKNSPFASLVSDDIAQFVLTHNLDDSAKAKLEELPLEQQVDVVSQDAANVRNINAVVISRCARCQREGSLFNAPASKDYVAGVVAKFIEMLGLDEKSAADLKALPANHQVAVMAKDMEGVTNPSGVVHSRIRKLQRGGPVGAGVMAGPPGIVPMNAVAAPVSFGPPMDATQYLDQAYATFLSQYSIDQKAQDQVAQLSPLEKLEVISQNMDNVWNPSGAVASRCSKVRNQAVNLGPRAVQWVREVANLICSSYGIEASSDAFQLLQTIPADKQFEVCSQSLSGARNPQSVMYCRLSKLGYTAPDKPKGAAAPVGAAPVGAVGAIVPSPASFARKGSGGQTSNVELFIAQYGLDDRAANVLRDLASTDPAGAEEVMQLPIGPEVRNPSGVIHQRVTSRTGGGFKKARVGPY